MVYVYYNLRLLVRQIQKTPDVDAISLDGIDTSVEWRVESERPILESMPDWIQEEVEGAVAEEEEAEGDVTEQSRHHLHGLRQRELYLAVAPVEDTRV
jgi:hypothetical protein